MIAAGWTLTETFPISTIPHQREKHENNCGEYHFSHIIFSYLNKKISDTKTVLVVNLSLTSKQKKPVASFYQATQPFLFRGIIDLSPPRILFIFFNYNKRLKKYQPLIFIVILLRYRGNYETVSIILSPYCPTSQMKQVAGIRHGSTATP
jgi:hypothetical protein